ncbi:MAG: DUF1302 domain-containing protein [Alcanivoracaceae bacterium]|nr:DUF1302 domain-containing protein [Alcanivoracaceae bacterium]
MKTKVFQPTRLVLAISSALTLGALTTHAGAAEFQLNNGEVTGRFDAQLTMGMLWRTEGQDAELAANEDPVAMAAKGYSTQLNKNDGNNNFDTGISSLVYKVTPELALNFNGQWGLFVRGTAFYDEYIMGRGHDGGELMPSAPFPGAGGINRYATYSDHANNGLGDGFTEDTKDYAGRRLRLLDAYVWTDVDLFGRTLGVRAGRQVITWGESLFVQNGVNTANYIDLAALRLPGAELKEALLPLGSLSFSYGLTDNLSMEGFYQFEWSNNEDAPVGSYYSTHDAFPGEGAENVIVDGRLVAAANGVPSIADDFAQYTINTYGLSGPNGYQYEQTQVTVDRLADEEPDDGGQFGLAFRYFADQLNGTEFGLYYSRLHARLPVVGSRVDQIGTGSLASRIDSARYFMVYPEDIDMFGVSFNTMLGQVSLAGELAYRPEQPIINEVGDNLIQSIAGVAASGAPVISDLTDHCVRTEVGGDCLAPGDNVIQGQNYYFYDEAETVTGSLLSIMSFGPKFGTDNLVTILELGFDATHGLNDDLRYNSTAALLDSEAQANSDDPNSLYLTEMAWGYRAVVQASYNDIFAGVVMTPSLRLSHDVEGNSPIGGNFLEDRKAATLGVNFVYLNNLDVGVQATSFWGGGYSNKLKDRNNASLTLSYSF